MMPVVHQETYCNLVSHLYAPPGRKYTDYTVTTGFYNSFISIIFKLICILALHLKLMRSSD